MGHMSIEQRLRKPLPPEMVQAFEARFGKRFSQAMPVREHHGRDESPFPNMLPDAVVFAESTDDVVFVVKACSQHGVPLIPYGSGSSLEGHLLAIEGGISLDVSAMNKIVSLNTEDLTVTVQPGMTRKQLNEQLRDTGLFFPIDPGADASIGGMASTRASGTNAVRYGTMRENVLGLEVVTAQGKVVRTARRARKSSAGYDLTRIFVGSEGTLGVITEVTVRLYPQPEAVSAAVCHFPTMQHAVAAVIQTIQMGVPVARVELMDSNAVRASNAYSHLTLRETPLLLFEFHGSQAAVQEQAQLVQEIARDHEGMDFEWANLPEERNRLWTARHNAYFAGLQLRPGCRASTTDVCVPISRLAECIDGASQLLAKASFPFTIVGHVGDGNFHVLMLLDPEDPKEWDESEQLNHALVEMALSVDGTCTGEHGIGLHKLGFMHEEHGEAALELMWALKRAYDPGNILNPGKVLPVL
ncbi:MAG: FAD-binding protein [Burkholderiaceae bacterium]|nr:FAD-binding protein [Burkholderiaceae bacterium]MCD8518091.1 FAD-binding protein [Burkholderiaceae bacterium]MCD8565107.1 FAD-binding protein [Burkholderiaceae bacterium]